MNKNQKSILVKLNRRLLPIMMICLLITLFISSAFLSPALAAQARKKSEMATDQMLDHLDMQFNTISNYSYSLINDSELRSLSASYLENPEQANYHKIKLKLHSFLTQLYPIRSIALHFPDGTLITSISNLNEEDYAILSSEWFQKKLSTNTSNGFSDFYNISADNSNSCCYFINFTVASKRLNLLVFFDTFNLTTHLGKIGENYVDDFEILNSKGISQKSNHLEEINKENNSPTSSYITKYLKKQTYKKQSNYNMWSIITHTSFVTIHKEYISVILYVLAAYVILTTLSLLLCRHTIRSLLNPITKLSDTMMRISDGDRSAKADIHTNDEIGNMAAVFNDMIDHLNYYHTEDLKKEKQTQYMRYCLMINQLDPHFIYNSLSIVTILARRSNNTEIVELNTALIDFLRDRLRLDSANVYDSISQELSVLEKYVFLSNYRFKHNPVKLIIDVDESIYDYKIPKIILLTLIENCFKHAFINPEKQYTLFLTITIDNNINIIVKDSGEGIRMDELQRINSLKPKQTSQRGKNIGIGNMKKILNYLYKDEYSLVFSSVPGEGTTVTLQLPNYEHNKSFIAE